MTPCHVVHRITLRGRQRWLDVWRARARSVSLSSSKRHCRLSSDSTASLAALATFTPSSSACSLAALVPIGTTHACASTCSAFVGSIVTLVLVKCHLSLACGVLANVLTSIIHCAVQIQRYQMPKDAPRQPVMLPNCAAAVGAAANVPQSTTDARRGGDGRRKCASHAGADGESLARR